MTGASTARPLADRSPASLRPLLQPRSVAILGASADPSRIGGRPIHYLKDAGFAGPIYPINPNRSEIQGLKAYAKIEEVPGAVDTVLVAVPAPIVVGLVRDAVARGVRSFVIFSSGFAEASAEGAAWQDELTRIAAESGARMIGPNCLGMFNTQHRYFATFSGSLDHGYPKPGRIAVVSQSGAYGSHMFVLARDKGLGTNYWLTTGNECDVDVADAISFFADDPDTDVIVVYVEAIKSRERLFQALARAHEVKKPIVIMKVGRSAVGAAAAASHTASLAGSDAVYDAVFRQFGVYRAETTEEMLDVAYAATRRIYPSSGRLGIVTISGGAGVLMADAAAAHGLDVPAMPEAAQRRLKEMLPFAAPRNPVDVTAMFFNDMSLVTKNLQLMLEEGGFDAIIAFVTSIPRTRGVGDKLRHALSEAVKPYPGRLLVLSMIATPEIVREYEAEGFLAFEDPSRGVAAIAALVAFGRAFAAGKGAPPPALPTSALPAPTGPTGESEAKRVLASVGIPVVEERVATSAAAAVAAAEALGYPVALKIASADIPHKTEIGGVLLGLGTAAEVESGFGTLRERAASRAPTARIDGIAVAPMIAGGVETILGVHRDAAFGPVVMFGLGGIFVEVLKDVSFRVAPFGIDQALAMIREVKGFPLLDGARGRPKMDLEALAAALSRLSVFAAANAERIESIDINPFIVLPRGALAVDALIIPRGT
ncbi:MAG: acetate--CoA ligase family protein [Proteobacteria bacterium]|nr:acetate--CoA ligase family protein [Pseudomonadota bacterium]MBI3499100.1 acetate--CoA ligase family protein [Pseudomonadota bacterium]